MNFRPVLKPAAAFAAVVGVHTATVTENPRDFAENFGRIAVADARLAAYGAFQGIKIAGNALFALGETGYDQATKAANGAAKGTKDRAPAPGF